MMLSVHRNNLRDALIAITVGVALAWLLSSCAAQPQPPPTPTAAQLAQVAASAPTPAPKVTGAMILAQQPPEVQQAIMRHAQAARWPSFRWPRQRLVPYTDYAAPLVLDLSPTDDVDLALQRGETIDGVAFGDSEEFMAAPIVSAVPHLILKCKVTGKDTTGAVYVSSGRIYRLHLRCRDKTTIDSISYYYPQQILAAMHAADAAPATPPQEADPIAPTIDAGRINRAYKIDGAKNIPWRPVAVMDDGARVWIETPHTTSPIAPILTGDDGATLNYRVRGNYYVVDSLFNHAQLTSGDDKVTITRVSQ
jgi:type IV secretory pathway VirB9-like protein